MPENFGQIIDRLEQENAWLRQRLRIRSMAFHRYNHELSIWKDCHRLSCRADRTAIEDYQPRT